MKGGEAAAPAPGPGRTDSRDGRDGRAFLSLLLSIGPAGTGAGRMGKQTNLNKPRRAAMERWKLKDAKARFSEVVRHAREEGPQRVSVRGRDAVMIMSVQEFERIVPERPRLPFVAFMESLHLDGLDLEREVDRGRDVER